MSSHLRYGLNASMCSNVRTRVVDLAAHLGTEHTSASSAAVGLKLSSWLLKRFIRLTGKLMSAVVTTSRQLRRTKAMQGSTNHSNSANICRTELGLNSKRSLACPDNLDAFASMATTAMCRFCRKQIVLLITYALPFTENQAICCRAQCTQQISRCKDGIPI